ncbi:MAG TPA: CHAP domain-containing protein [Alphaproteobacteria bacterium]
MPRLAAVPWRSALPVLLILLILSGCTGRTARQASPVLPETLPAVGSELRPQMVAVRRPVQCVAYARALSGLPIRGDAWTWWPAADGRYLRNRTPRPGALLVLERTRRLRHGHLAMVTHVLGPRQILVDHANWLNQGRIHRHTPVVDVSPGNDWSLVRVWYIPGNRLGSNSYPAYGFVHPEALTAAAPSPARRNASFPPARKS